MGTQTADAAAKNTVSDKTALLPSDKQITTSAGGTQDLRP